MIFEIYTVTSMDIIGSQRLSLSRKKTRGFSGLTTFCHHRGNKIIRMGSKRSRNHIMTKNPNTNMILSQRRCTKNTQGQSIDHSRNDITFLNMQRKNNEQRITYDAQILDKCTQLMVTDFKSLPFKKLKKTDEESNADRHIGKVLEKSLRNILESNPPLLQIYHDYDQVENNDKNETMQQLPLNQMIAKVGPYHKPSFLQMISKHPILFTNALKSNNLKVRLFYNYSS